MNQKIDFVWLCFLCPAEQIVAINTFLIKFYAILTRHKLAHSTSLRINFVFSNSFSQHAAGRTTKLGLFSPSVQLRFFVIISCSELLCVYFYSGKIGFVFSNPQYASRNTQDEQIGFVWLCFLCPSGHDIAITIFLIRLYANSIRHRLGLFFQNQLRMNTNKHEFRLFFFFPSRNTQYALRNTSKLGLFFQNTPIKSFRI